MSNDDTGTPIQNKCVHCGTAYDGAACPVCLERAMAAYPPDPPDYPVISYYLVAPPPGHPRHKPLPTDGFQPSASARIEFTPPQPRFHFAGFAGEDIKQGCAVILDTETGQLHTSNPETRERLEKGGE